MESIEKLITDHWPILIIMIIVLFVLIITLNNNYEYYTSYPSYCPRCDILDKEKCDSCINCGYCVTRSGKGSCVDGDSEGPLFATDCVQYTYVYDPKNINRDTGLESQRILDSLNDRAQQASQEQTTVPVPVPVPVSAPAPVPVPQSEIESEAATQPLSIPQKQPISEPQQASSPNIVIGVLITIVIIFIIAIFAFYGWSKKSPNNNQ